MTPSLTDLGPGEGYVHLVPAPGEFSKTTRRFRTGSSLDPPCRWSPGLGGSQPVPPGKPLPTSRMRKPPDDRRVEFTDTSVRGSLEVHALGGSELRLGDDDGVMGWSSRDWLGSNLEHGKDQKGSAAESAWVVMNSFGSWASSSMDGRQAECSLEPGRVCRGPFDLNPGAGDLVRSVG